MRIIVFIFFLFSNNLLSQDLLYKTSGEEIEVKVFEVGEDYLVYKKKGLENGPDFKIPLKKVFMVIYENGEKMVFTSVSKKNSKVSNSKKEIEISKFYLGIGAGVAFRGGDINYWNNYSTGINLNFLNLGYRINDTFGVSANLNSSAHTLGVGSAIGIAYLSFGGIFSIPTNYFTVDIKPQYAPRVLALFNGTVLDNLGLYESYLFGRGFVFSNSIVRSTGKGFSYSLDLDFLLSKFNEARLDGIYYDDSSVYNSFRIGLGVRYNF